jgi:hypothetical protein
MELVFRLTWIYDHQLNYNLKICSLQLPIIFIIIIIIININNININMLLVSTF